MKLMLAFLLRMDFDEFTKFSKRGLKGRPAPREVRWWYLNAYIRYYILEIIIFKIVVVFFCSGRLRNLSALSATPFTLSHIENLEILMKTTLPKTARPPTPVHWIIITVLARRGVYRDRVPICSSDSFVRVPMTQIRVYRARRCKFFSSRFLIDAHFGTWTVISW